MSEADERKRDRSLDEEDVRQEKEKQLRAKSPEAPLPAGITYDAWINADDMLTAAKTPLTDTKKTPQPIRLLERCKEMGIDGSPPQSQSLQKLYGLFVELEARVSTQEKELSNLQNLVSEKDDEIFKLRKDNAFLQKQISDVRVDALSASMPPTTNLPEELAVTSEGLAKAEAVIESLTKEVSDLTEKRGNLDEKYKWHIRRLHLEEDRLTQYSMRDSIKISGVPYKAGEDTNELVCRIAYSLGISINEHDISVSHRTGKRQGVTPRPIVCKFTRRATKHAILQNKHLARNIKTDDDGNIVKLYIDEHLTPLRGRVCKWLRSKKVLFTTRDGKIFITPDNSDKIIIDFPEDWEHLDMSISEKEEIGICPKW